jgi:hypothetical protein
MSALVALPKEAQDVTEKALTIPERVSVLQITSSETYTLAAQLWQDIRAMRKEVDAAFQPIRERAHAAWKETIAQHKKIDDPLAANERTVKQAMESYDAIQERKRREEEARLREIARKEEEERRLAEAVMAEQEGDQETAEVIMEEPVYVPPVVVPKSVPKVAGGPVFRTIWKARVINENMIPREYMAPDMVKLNKMASAMKGALKIPGVEFYSERV